MQISNINFFIEDLIHPSLNKWTRGHWSVRKYWRDKFDKAIKNKWNQFGQVIFNKPVNIEIVYHVLNKGRYDLDNYVPKFIFDALKDKFIVDDSDRYIKSYSVKIKRSSGLIGTDVTIKTIDE